MSEATKQSIYVDPDDEITAIIDKVNSADAKIIALVLPKRAAVFQSVVNMKLLKRRADKAGKHVVLITSEAGLLPLAGLSGMYVASSLQSKPAIPEGPAHDADEAFNDQELTADIGDEPVAANKTVGELAGGAKPRVIAPAGMAGDGDIELDNTEPAAKAAKSQTADKPSRKKSAHGVVQSPDSKGFAIPDFFRFRKRLLLGFLVLLLLIGGYIVAFRVLPKGTVTVATKTDDINTSLNVTLKTGTTSLDEQNLIVPASLQQQQKTYTQQAAATGSKNNGNKASGDVTLTNCSQNGDSVTIPAGTGVSANGLTYITQESTTLRSSNFDFNRNCKSTGESSDSVKVEAQQAGASYNISNTSVTVAGQSTVQGRVNGDISGGSDQIVKVVQQSDIDSAKAKLNIDADKDAMQKQLQQSLQNGDYFAVTASFVSAPGTANVSTQANQPADNVTVTEAVNYSMYGVKRSDLSKLVKTAASKQIDAGKQSILDDGVNGAKFDITTPGSGSELKARISTVATAGPKLDIDSLATQLKGKKTGDAKAFLQATPGVEDVTVSYSPFWVTRLPNNADKITVNFTKSDTKAGND